MSLNEPSGANAASIPTSEGSLLEMYSVTLNPSFWSGSVPTPPKQNAYTCVRGWGRQIKVVCWYTIVWVFTLPNSCIMQNCGTNWWTGEEEVQWSCKYLGAPTQGGCHTRVELNAHFEQITQSVPGCWAIHRKAQYQESWHALDNLPCAGLM